MKSRLPAIDVVQKMLWVDFDAGTLFWLPRTPDLFLAGKQSANHNCAIWNGRYANQPAFTAVDSLGYFTGSLFNVKVRAHVVIWALHRGEWPTQVIDHINQNKLDNRLCNLRQVDKSLNAVNSKTRVDNTSGHRGVTWHKALKKWLAQANRGGRNNYLGVFEDIADAVEARRKFDDLHPR